VALVLMCLPSFFSFVCGNAVHLLVAHHAPGSHFHFIGCFGIAV
jgi:hypothetical protein